MQRYLFSDSGTLSPVPRIAADTPCVNLTYGQREYPYKRGPMLPPLHTFSTCDDSIWSVRHRLEAQRFLRETQFPQSCSSASLAVIGPFAQSGVGSTIHLIMGAFNAALCMNRTVVYAETQWIWSECPRKTPDCYFVPISSCKGSDSVDRIYLSAATRHPMEKCVPEQLGNRPYNWWRTMLLDFLVQPLPYVQEHVVKLAVATYRNALPSRPLLAVFIRRSEKVREMERLYELHEYRTSWSELRHLGGLYVNSEDPLIMPSVHELQSAKETLYVPPLPRGFNFDIWDRRNASHHVLSFLADLFMEVAADFHGGTLSSNWCRLVDALRLARGKTRTRFYSPERLPNLFFDS